MNCEISEDGLQIKDLVIKDNEVMEYYSGMDKDELCENVEKALRLGTIALKTVKVTEKIDYIKKEFNILGSSFEDTLEEAIKQIDGYVGKNGELQRKIEEFFGKDGRIIHELFDPDRKGTPLNKLKQDIIYLMMEKEREKSKPTKIGDDFEDHVENGLNEIIRSRRNCCDVIHDTANERGLMDTTTGDFVIDIEGREDCKLVIEVKDFQNINGTAIKSNMEKALENRGASYGIFINKNVEGLPGYMGWFHDYPKDKYLVCALSSENDDALHDEMLHMAYEWARTKAMYERAVVEGIDISHIEDAMEDIKQGIEKIKHLRGRYTLIEKTVDEMRDISYNIEDLVKHGLENIQDEINKSIESE